MRSSFTGQSSGRKDFVADLKIVGGGEFMTTRNIIDSLDMPPFFFLSDHTGFM